MASSTQGVSVQIRDVKEELAAVDAELAIKERELQDCEDRKRRIEELTANTEVINTRITEMKEYITEAEERLKVLPTEQEVHELRERLDELQIAVMGVEDMHFTSVTGLKAYSQRRKSNLESMVALTEALEKALEQISAVVKPLVEEEQGVKEASAICGGLEEMLSIDLAREDELQRIVNAFDGLLASEKTKADEYAALKRTADAQLPQIEEERDRCLEEITNEWMIERNDLITVYQRLLMLNKEQHHHLLRGTHVKRAPQKFTEVALQTLNMQNAELSKNVHENRELLDSLKADLNGATKFSNIIHEKGRKQQAWFEKLKAEKLKELEEAQRVLREAKDEGDELRNVKVELQSALVDMRDTRSLMLKTLKR